MRTLVAEPVGDYVADLGEGPCWLADGRLTWVDVLLGRLLVADPLAGMRVATRYAPGLHVTAALPLEDAEDGWILAAGTGFVHLRPDGSQVALAQPELDRQGFVRMNDAKCDPVGRLWAGSMGYDERPGAGSLYRVDLDGTVTRVLEGLQISNGIDWSPDGRTFYFVDTGRRTLYSAPYDLDRGSIGELQPLVEPPPSDGGPDGLTVDAEGTIWVAFWGGGGVHRYDPTGRLLERIEVASPFTTSCCLGGADGRTLFVTSAKRPLSYAQRCANPDAGRIFAAAVDAVGVPTRPFRGVLPEATAGAGSPGLPARPERREPSEAGGAEAVGAAGPLVRLGLAARVPEAPASDRRFPDGGAYRIEIPSVESPAALRAVIAEAAEREVPVHRVSQGSGVTLLTDDEIAEMLAICREADIELCLFLGPRASWSTGGGRASTAGSGGARARGADQLRESIADARRAVELGVRCLLTADEGVLWTLHRLRAAGELPDDLTLKVSALSGPLNPAAFALLERIGADSINVHSDLTAAQIGELRVAGAAAIDLYVEAPDDLGGFVRHHEAAEFVRVGAPVYLKFGLRNAPPLYPVGGHLAQVAVETARERVRRAAICLDVMAAGSVAPPSPVPARRPPEPLERFPLPPLAERVAPR